MPFHDAWFKDTLQKESSLHGPICVIGHYPLYLDKPDEKEQYPNLPPDKRTELLALFKQNKVNAYLSGHTHRLIVNSYEGIQLVSGETTSKNVDKRPFGFRLWNVSGDTINHEFVPLAP